MTKKQGTDLGWWMEAMTGVGCSGSWAMDCKTFATLDADTESKPDEKANILISTQTNRRSRKRIVANLTLAHPKSTLQD
jgi:hypothetical protein